jgi:hypothetical protein
MVTADDVREIALVLPRAYEALVRDRVKFRVGRIVFVSLSRDEKVMGFGYPKEERDALIASQPEKFHLPAPSDMRYNWVQVWLDRIDRHELHELIVDAWRMVVPKKVWSEYADRGQGLTGYALGSARNALWQPDPQNHTVRSP